MRVFRLIILLMAAACCFGSRGAESDSLPPGVQPLPDSTGLHNVFALSTNVYSGSAPEGDAAFETLARLGIKTIITVDGGRPDIEAAHRHGLRYVHLPHGYDGISTNTQMMLARAAGDLPGPLYVHCHHGKHRGPAAAAIICMAQEGWPAEQALNWLAAAGTSTNYAGLYDSIRTFDPPTAAELKSVPADFPEIAEVSGLTESMVGIDERWENLKAVRNAGYATPPDHPDIDPANEAVILWELYREAQRLPGSAAQGHDFMAQLRQAEKGAREAERLLRLHPNNPGPELRAELDDAFTAMGRACSACHQTYRNPARIRAGQ